MTIRNLAPLAMWLKSVRARTWLILAAILLTLIGLTVWAGIALLSWLWSMAPTVTEQGKRVVGETATRIEEAAPGLKAQAEQWVPQLREQAGKLLPGLAADLPAHDVSGTDIGPVARFPGLLRTQFARTEKSVEVRYAGRAAFDAVLTHYVQGLTGAGFAHEVISATPEEEQHQFRRGKESIDFGLLRRPAGLIEVRLQQISRQ